MLPWSLGKIVYPKSFDANSRLNLNYTRPLHFLLSFALALHKQGIINKVRDFTVLELIHFYVNENQGSVIEFKENDVYHSRKAVKPIINC